MTKSETRAMLETMMTTQRATANRKSAILISMIPQGETEMDQKPVDVKLARVRKSDLRGIPTL